jgi:hypothetical protein
VTRLAWLAAVVLALATAGAASSQGRAGPATLVTAKGPIAAFAQDGGQLAWASIDPGPACPWKLRIRLLAAHKQKAVNTGGGPTCASDTGFDPSHSTWLALAGTRALWTLYASGNNSYVDLVTASYTSGDIQLQELVFSNGLGDGDHLGGLAGDGSTLVYGVVHLGVSGPPDCDVDGTCTLVVSSGQVKRVVGNHAVAVPGAQPPLMLAASGGSIAEVVAESASSGEPAAGSPATVVVLKAATGASVGSFSTATIPREIALAPKVVAVLETVPGGSRIEFRTPAGLPIRTVAVPATASSLSLTNLRAVFRIGNSIQAVGVAAGGVHALAHAAATPVGLSIEGTRVAWAENVTIAGKLRGRIQAFTAP